MLVNTLERKYADDDEVASISNMFWLNHYYIIRTLEQGYKITPLQAKNQVQHLLRIFKRRGQEAALEAMEKKFLKLDKLAIPTERRKYFNYSPLNVQGVIYEEKKNEFLNEHNQNNY